MTEEFINSGGEFKKVRLDSLFCVKSNPQLDKDAFTFSESSTYPYFTRTVFNNGIFGYVDYLDKEHLIKGNSIAVGMMGMQFFYMPHDFYAGQFTKTLSPLFAGFDEDIALYYIAILNRFQSMLKGELVRNFENKLLSQEITLPIRGKMVDIFFQRRYIATLKAERVATLKAYLQACGLADTQLSKEEKEVLRTSHDKKQCAIKMGDLFEIQKGKRLTKQDMKPGNINFIGAISVNNGIREKIDAPKTWQPNCITVNYNGSVGYSFYQEQTFYASDDVNVLYLLHHKLNRNIALYFCSAIFKYAQKHSYAAKWTKDKMLKTPIILPVTDTNDIDYNFMETYISAQIKLCISFLMSAKDMEISTTENIVNQSQYSYKEEIQKYAFAAEPLEHYGGIDVLLPKEAKEDLTLMYAISPSAREKTQTSGKIALGIKEQDLEEHILEAYKNVKHIVFHYWKNETAALFTLTDNVMVVEEKDIPNGYLIRQSKDAKRYLLLQYNPMDVTQKGILDILKVQRSKERRYLPFVTTMDSITVKKIKVYP